MKLKQLFPKKIFIFYNYCLSLKTEFNSNMLIINYLDLIIQYQQKRNVTTDFQMYKLILYTYTEEYKYISQITTVYLKNMTQN